MAKRTKSYGLTNPLQDVFPVPVISRRIPNEKDTQYELGQTWVNEATSQIFALASITDGGALWSLLGDSLSDLSTLTGDTGGPLSPASGNINIFGGTGITVDGSGSTLIIDSSGIPVTLFVVGSPSSGVGFSTIQAAIDAANSAGEGIVVVQPGTFTENLTLFDGIHVMGLTFADAGGGVVINGTHTPPNSGGFVFRNVRLVGNISIFNTLDAGSAHLMIADADVRVTSGHTYDLPNWTGKLEFWNVDSSGGTNDGCVNNLGGSEIAANASKLGAGSSQVMNTSGLFDCNSIELLCPINCQTGTVLALDNGFFFNAFLLSNNTTGSITVSSFQTAIGESLEMESSGDVSLENCSLDSSAPSVITGSGSGTLRLTGIDFVNQAFIGGGLTLAGGTTTTGTFETIDPAAGLSISGSNIDAEGTNANITVAVNPKGSGDFIVSTAGGISLTGATASNLTVSGPAIDVNLIAAGGSVNLLGTEAAADAISIDASNAAGGVQINAGTNDVQILSSLRLPTAATQLQVEGGASTDFIGRASLVSGTIVVANTNIAANDRIFLTRSGVGASTTLGVLQTQIIPSTSFVVTALQPGNPGTTETGDASTVDYFIVRQL